MKYLHHTFREALADESNCLFEDGVLYIRHRTFTPVDIVDMCARADGSTLVFDELFTDWLNEWKERQCEEAERILDEYEQRDRFQRLVEAKEGGFLVPFVGAGLSIPSGYPSWTVFLHRVRRESTISEDDLDALLTVGRYEDAAQCLADALGAGFNEILENCFAVRRTVSGAVGLLPYLFTGPVITTNFDTVLERVYDAAEQPFSIILSGVESKRYRITSREHPHLLLKLHGQADTCQGRVLTTHEYDTHYADDATLKNIVKLLYDQNQFLFLGCSLGVDRLLKACKEHVADVGHDNLPKHYAFLSAPESYRDRVARKSQLADCHIYPIWYSGDHDESITALLIKLHKDAK